MIELIVLDMEYTTFPDARENKWSKPNEFREIVQIAAKKIQISNNNIEVMDTFNFYVLPRINNILSDFFVNLTGITQAEIELKGLDFEIVLKSLIDFIGNTKVITWTNNDYDVIIENIKIYNIDSIIPAKFFDLREIFLKNDLPININSGHLAESYGLPAVNQEHNAIDDVSSIVATIEYLLKSEQININDFSDYKH